MYYSHEFNLEYSNDAFARHDWANREMPLQKCRGSKRIQSYYTFTYHVPKELKLKSRRLVHLTVLNFKLDIWLKH